MSIEIKSKSGKIIKTFEEESLYEKNLVRANFKNAILTFFDFRKANLQEADFTNADLYKAHFEGADLENACFFKANLKEANFNHANLTQVDFGRADLTGVSLINAKTIDTNFSQTKGILSASEWLAENFETFSGGYIVYKAFGSTYYPQPRSWKRSKFIVETPNSNRSTHCGCGINFGTISWMLREFEREISTKHVKVRRMYLHWKDLPDVVVPYNVCGKARCRRLEKGEWLSMEEIHKLNSKKGD